MQKRDVFVPQIEMSFILPENSLDPYTPAEMAEKVSELRGRTLFIDFQKDVDGPQTAVKLIEGELAGCGKTNVSQSII